MTRPPESCVVPYFYQFSAPFFKLFQAFSRFVWRISTLLAVIGLDAALAQDSYLAATSQTQPF
jgi:hypothetical protein